MLILCWLKKMRNNCYTNINDLINKVAQRGDGLSDCSSLPTNDSSWGRHKQKFLKQF